MLAENIIEKYIVKSEKAAKWIIISCISGFEVPLKISFYYYITYRLLQTYSVEKIFLSLYNAQSSGHEKLVYIEIKILLLENSWTHELNRSIIYMYVYIFPLILHKHSRIFCSI